MYLKLCVSAWTPPRNALLVSMCRDQLNFSFVSAAVIRLPSDHAAPVSPTVQPSLVLASGGNLVGEWWCLRMTDRWCCGRLIRHFFRQPLFNKSDNTLRTILLCSASVGLSCSGGVDRNGTRRCQVLLAAFCCLYVGQGSHVSRNCCTTRCVCPNRGTNRAGVICQTLIASI